MTSDQTRNFIIAVLILGAVWYQAGGIGLASPILYEDITLRQATCELMSAVSLVGAFVIVALTPTK